jgi:hypothetical protein
MGQISIERFNNIIYGRITPVSSNRHIDLMASGLKESLNELDPVVFDSQEYINQYKCDLLEADEKRIPLKEFADRFPAYVKSSAYLGHLGKNIEFVAPFLADFKPLSPFLTNFKNPGSIVDLPSKEQYPKEKRCKAANFMNEYLGLMIQANNKGSEQCKTHTLLANNFHDYIKLAKVLGQQKAAFALVWPYLNKNIFRLPVPISEG